MSPAAFHVLKHIEFKSTGQIGLEYGTAFLPVSHYSCINYPAKFLYGFHVFSLDANVHSISASFTE
jgi:hypothetical protein